MPFDSDSYSTATVAKIFNGCDIAQIVSVVVELVSVDVIHFITVRFFTEPRFRHERRDEDVYHFAFDVYASTKVSFIADLKLTWVFELHMTQYLPVAAYLIAVLK